MNERISFFKHVQQNFSQEQVDRLVKTFGGGAIWFPASNFNDSKVSEGLRGIFGADALGDLCKIYGGGSVTVPNANKKLSMSELMDRNRAIVDDINGGITQSESARKYGLSARAVCTIVARARGWTKVRASSKSPEQIEELMQKVRELKKQGMPLKQIGKTLTISTRTISKYAPDLSVRKLPPRYRPAKKITSDADRDMAIFMQDLEGETDPVRIAVLKRLIQTEKERASFAS